MRPTNINSAFYVPQPVPSNPADLANYLRTELAAIQNVISILAAGHIDTTYAAPEKPRDGDLRLADGVLWDPGSGQGVYCYYNGTWNKLG
jgi:hypothetical protein